MKEERLSDFESVRTLNEVSPLPPNKVQMATAACTRHGLGKVDSGLANCPSSGHTHTN